MTARLSTTEHHRLTQKSRNLLVVSNGCPSGFDQEVWTSGVTRVAQSASRGAEATRSDKARLGRGTAGFAESIWQLPALKRRWGCESACHEAVI